MEGGGKRSLTVLLDDRWPRCRQKTGPRLFLVHWAHIRRACAMPSVKGARIGWEGRRKGTEGWRGRKRREGGRQCFPPRPPPPLLHYSIFRLPSPLPIPHRLHSLPSLQPLDRCRAGVGNGGGGRAVTFPDSGKEGGMDGGERVRRAVTEDGDGSRDSNKQHWVAGFRSGEEQAPIVRAGGVMDGRGKSGR
jgi:hypothetical protein